MKNMDKNLELPTLKCKKCSHEWIIRKINPLKCPCCGFPVEQKIEVKLHE
jgi:predicted Zn-ribbon and HTH transcriptional regulator